MSPPRSLSVPRFALLLLLVGLSGCHAAPTEKQTTARQGDGHIRRAKDTQSTSVEPPVSSSNDAAPYRPTEGDFVDDCKGGQTKMPVWFSRLLYSRPLCVKGRPGGTNINVGTNLAEPLDAWKGEGKYQVYYSLSRVAVQDGQSSLVWAVCGGVGAMLEKGAWVVPVPSLSVAKLSELREIVARLEAQEERYNETLELFKYTGDPKLKAHFQGSLERLLGAMDDQIGVLRPALIATNKEVLRDSGNRPVAPTSQVPSTPPSPKSTSKTSAEKKPRPRILEND